jgi:uncharacterized protein (DUF3084 family)
VTTNGHQDYRRQVRVNTAVLRAHLAEAQRVFRLLEADAVMALAELDRLLEERDKLVAQVQALTATIAHQGESYRTILREAAAQMDFDSRMLNRRTPSRGEEVARFYGTTLVPGMTKGAEVEGKTAAP